MMCWEVNAPLRLLANQVMSLAESRCAEHHHYFCDRCASWFIENYITQQTRREGKGNGR